MRVCAIVVTLIVQRPYRACPVYILLMLGSYRKGLCLQLQKGSAVFGILNVRHICALHIVQVFVDDVSRHIVSPVCLHMVQYISATLSSVFLFG